MNSSDTSRAKRAAAKTTSQGTTTAMPGALVADITNTAKMHRWQMSDTVIVLILVVAVALLWLG